jgi:cohesin loading factor subunit SCC2
MNTGFDINSLAGRSPANPNSPALQMLAANNNPAAMAAAAAAAAAAANVNFASANSQLNLSTGSVGHHQAHSSAHHSQAAAHHTNPSTHHSHLQHGSPAVAASSLASSPFIGNAANVAGPPGISAAHLNNTNALASSVNLSSIQSMIDLLHELPLPSETPQQSAKEQVLINSMQQQQHVQSNLHTELMQQHYLAHQMTNPLVLAKQQMQELNLQWLTNTPTVPPADPTSTEQRQFSTNHENNAFLLSLVQQKNIFEETVVLPPVPKHFTPTQQHTTSTQPPVQTPQQPPPPTEPSPTTVRQTRSQAQPQYWNPFINEQLPPTTPQSQQPTPPTAQHPPKPTRQNSQSLGYGNDNSNSSSSFSDNSNIVAAGLLHGSSVTNTPTHLSVQPGMSPAMGQYAGPAVASASPHPLQTNSQQFQRPDAHFENGTANKHILVQNVQQGLPDNNLLEQELAALVNDSAYSSLGDRVKSKKRTNRQPELVVPSPQLQPQMQQQFQPSLQPQQPPIQQPLLSPEAQIKTEPKLVYNKNLNSSQPQLTKPFVNEQPPQQATFALVPPPVSVPKPRPPKPKPVERKERPPPQDPPSPPVSSHQLASQNLSVPPSEKFEAMLNELFDVNQKIKKKKKSILPDDDDLDVEFDDDDESEMLGEVRKLKKSKHRKQNGELSSETAMLFDISLSGSTLLHLVNLTAKLKRSNQMKQMPSSKLTNLLTVLTHQLAIQSASLKDKKREQPDDDDEDSSQQSNYKVLMDKFELCCDCCLVSLNIMTSKGMCSRVYLEECIEQIIAFLNSTIGQYTGTGSSLSSPMKGSKGKGRKSSSSTQSTAASKKLLLRMYTKWSELIAGVAELLRLHSGTLTDTLVLSTTRVALNAFFLESLSNGPAASSTCSDSNEIQLNALNLTCAIFAQYGGHRQVILEEIIHSISRLSTSKRGRVFYKIDGDEKNTVISMFSALVFKLMQSFYVDLENSKNKAPENSESTGNGTATSEIQQTVQRVELLKRTYNEMLLTAAGFLDSFLKKCVGANSASGSNALDADFRFLFENLVNDLMVVLHKPSWPAAQLLAHVMMTILTSNVFGNTKGSARSGAATSNVNLQLRLCSLDYLGGLCSRYAKELSCVNELRTEVKDALRNIRVNSETAKPRKEDKKEKRSKSKMVDALDPLLENDEALIGELWKHLIRYTDEEKLSEEKNLFVSIWIREMERQMQTKRKEVEASNEEATDSNQPTQAPQLDQSVQEQFERDLRRFMKLYKNASNANVNNSEEYHVVDSKTAELIIRYLDITMSNTTRMFDFSLKHVIASLSNTTNPTMRSRAMKSLSTVLNNAPRAYASSLLSRNDLKMAIKNSLMDPSSSVREATIDLIGKFILNCQSEDLIDRYYDLITARILDTGVSVRKRVIKILREVCLNYPTYAKIPEICSKVIKRVNDDGEGIRKLVSETFTSMWFKEEQSREAIKLKVECIVHVVSTVVFERIGTEWLQQLLSNLLSPPGDPASKGMLKEEEERDSRHMTAQQLAQVAAASSQIVDVLVREMLCSGENEQRNKTVTVSAMTTLWLFGKVSPKLIVDHISVIQPFLSMRCSTQLDTMILVKVIQIIEHVLPKLSNPSEYLLTSIEEELTKLIIQSNAQVLNYCVSCLSSLIHKHTHNKDLVVDLFKRFFFILQQMQRRMELAHQAQYKPRISRALFTCGLFAKHFEFIEQKTELFRITLEFIVTNLPNENGYLLEDSHFAELCGRCDDPSSAIRENVDYDLLLNALSGLGFILEGTPSFLLRDDAQRIYKGILKRKFTALSAPIDEFSIYNPLPKPLRVKTVSNAIQFEESTICAVLKNFTNYLSDQLNSEMSLTIEWSKENLKSMSCDEGDSNSEQSAIIQVYLEDVVTCTLSPQVNIRKGAVNLIHIIHSGGIVHPLQLAPYLIAMSSDDELSIRTKADHVLNEIERKYHGFVSIKAKQGVILSYQLHQTSGKRGYRIETTINSTSCITSNASSPAHQASSPAASSAPLATGSNGNAAEEKFIIARLSTLYSVVNSNKQSRRAFIVGLLKYFEPLNSSNFANGQMALAEIDHRQRERIEIQQYICDNLTWLPYSAWDEVLFIQRQFEHSISMNANQADLLFKELLQLEEDDEDEEAPVNEQKLQERIQCKETSKYNLLSYAGELNLRELVSSVQSFYTLSWTKQVIRELFLITDAKVQEYSANENQKIWEKPVHKKSVSDFQKRFFFVNLI